MTYINHFVDSSISAPESANLSVEEQNIISGAVATIDNWNILCDQGVSIAMATNPDIKYITESSNVLKQKAQTLTNATALLKSKLTAFNIPNYRDLKLISIPSLKSSMRRQYSSYRFAISMNLSNVQTLSNEYPPDVQFIQMCARFLHIVIVSTIHIFHMQEPSKISNAHY